MTENKPTDLKALAKALIKEAEIAQHKEAYMQLQHGKTFRVGIGARAETPKPSPSLFIEAVINLTPNSEVDLHQLEKTIKCLKKLQAKKYTLTYQGNSHVTCEATATTKNLTKKYITTLTLLKNTLN